MRFRVGSYVKIKTNLICNGKKEYSEKGVLCCTEMKQYLGETTQITETISGWGFTLLIEIDIEINKKHTWTDKMLLKPTKKEIELYKQKLIEEQI